jgi:chromosomal replication initiation ATPase DnaA
MSNQNASETENPQGVAQLSLTNDELTYKQVEEKVLEFLPGYQTGLKLVLAVAVSSQFENPHMLWLLLVGAPSSGKTDLVRLIKGSDLAFYLDNLTQKKCFYFW